MARYQSSAHRRVLSLIQRRRELKQRAEALGWTATCDHLTLRWRISIPPRGTLTDMTTAEVRKLVEAAELL
jgi:hypothetical protein